MTIRIIKCSDSLRWYARYVGYSFTVVRKYRDEYLVQDPEGYSNYVLHQDAEVIAHGN